MLGICSLSVLVFHETLLVPVLKYGSETMLWKKEKSRVRAVQMDNLRGLLDFRRMDRVPNTWIMELCRVKKDLDEGIDEDVLQWLRHVEGMKRDRIAKRFYVGVLIFVKWVGRGRGIDTMKECLKKIGLAVRQERRMVGFVRGNAWGVAQGMNP